MPDWGNYTTVASNGQDSGLTYAKCRGYHHWVCIVCRKRERERIPDQADDTYRHNPGNPVMAICDKCNHGKGTGRIRLAPRRSKRQALKESKDNTSPLDYDSEALSAPWDDYMAIARRFEHKADYQDREDLRHDIVLTLAEVAKNNGHKPMSQASMHRIAAKVVADYWRSHYRHTNGLDCRWCSEDQRKECKDSGLYSSCPKAIRVESLSKPITDQDGNITELGQLIADDKAIDLADWVEVNTWRLGYPSRLVEIADKIRRGEKLSKTDRQYLWRYRNRAQLPMM
ncbi:hypothetical protein M1N46_01605 [Dehalococcoidia bacterium]|nr:hypothetical protein [Dehalococcoidia bacterium]